MPWADRRAPPPPRPAEEGPGRSACAAVTPGVRAAGCVDPASGGGRGAERPCGVGRRLGRAASVTRPVPSGWLACRRREPGSAGRAGHRRDAGADHRALRRGVAGVRLAGDRDRRARRGRGRLRGEELDPRRRRPRSPRPTSGPARRRSPRPCRPRSRRSAGRSCIASWTEPSGSTAARPLPCWPCCGASTTICAPGWAAAATTSPTAWLNAWDASSSRWLL